MAGGYVAARVNRTNWSVLLLCTIIVAGGAAVAVACRNSVYNAWAGPFSVEPDELLSRRGDPRQTYFRVQFDQIKDTGFYRKQTQNGVETGVIAKRYFAAVIGTRLLIIETPGDASGSVFSGELEPINSEVKAKIVRAYEQRYPLLAGKFANQMFVVRNCAENTAIGFSILGVILAVSLFHLLIALGRIAIPHSHPVYRMLTAMGNVQKLEQEIDAEFAAGPRALGSFRFTANWITNASALRFQLMRNSELLWVYLRRHTTRFYGIPAARKYFVVFCDRHGVKITIPAQSQQLAEQMLAAYVSIAPWAVSGYDSEIARRWKHDREAMIAQADQRRARSDQTARPKAA